MAKTSALMLGLVGVAATALVAVPLAAALESDMNDILAVLNKTTTETVETLDRAWEIALRFKDPNFKYDPSMLGEPPKSLSKTLENVTMPDEQYP